MFWDTFVMSQTSWRESPTLGETLVLHRTGLIPKPPWTQKG